MGDVIAIIPARSGSKGIHNKNIRLMNGKPLLAYSIEQALASSMVDRVLVSTDSPHYREIAMRYGAEAPFLRPQAISQDTSLDIEVFQHVLRWLKEHEGYEPEICVHLRPTHPIRTEQDINAMLEILKTSSNLDSVRSVSPVKQTPYKMWRFQEDSLQISPLVECGIPEAYNAPRQILPEVYMQNACIDVVRAKVVWEQNSMNGQHIAGYRMQYDFDVDTEEDFLRAEQAQLLLQARGSGRSIKICCDIDGVLAAKIASNNYNEATPMQRNIDIINTLYEKGHVICLFTARGYCTGIDWQEVTERQLMQWGVKFHELLFGKPNADVYLDDKFMLLDSLKYLL